MAATGVERATTMRRLDLREWQRSEPVRLTRAEREALRHSLPSSLGIEPAPDSEHAWLLTPGETVGALEVGELSVSIRPKLDVGRVLFLASYAMGAFKLREAERFSFPDADTLVEGLARVFAASARRAFSRGLVHGYRTEEEALNTVRGRIRFADQMRRRFGIPMPVGVRYDDFTEDVLANRLVRRAAERLGRMRIRSPSSRAGLAWIDATLENVALVEYRRHAVPEVVFNRLNEHYRELVALARLILRHATIETGRGAVRAPGFLMDMNRVFQEFVTRALREALRSPTVPSGPTAGSGASRSTRLAVSISGPTSPGGTDRPVGSSATPSTSVCRTGTSLTPISINSWRKPPPSICRAGCSSMPKERLTTRSTWSATPAGGWKSPRWTSRERSTTCAVASKGWRSGSAVCATQV